VAPDGTLWAATAGGAMFMRDGRWTSAGSFLDATSIAVGSDGTVWLGGATGALWMRPPGGDSWVADGIARPPLPTSAGGFRSVMIGPVMAVDRDGGLWLSGSGKSWLSTPGLVRLAGRGSAWETMSPIEGWTSMNVNDIATAPNGDVWIATTDDGGSMQDVQAAVYDGQSWTTFGAADGLPVDSGGLVELAVAPDGTVWVSAEGWASYRAGHWTPHYEGHDLGRIAFAPDGTLWASGELGVVRIVDPPH
jgi:hypothetical protein